MYSVNWAQESSNSSLYYDISVFRADIFVARSEPDWKAYANEAIIVNIRFSMCRNILNIFKFIKQDNI